MLFSYPLLVAAAGMGWEGIYDLMKGRVAKIIAYVITALLLALPLAHIIKNHPHEYVYYNEFAGGLNKCYGFYETDYYQHSTRAATLWLDNYLKTNHKLKEGQKIIVASNDNHSITYYLRKDTNRYYTTRYLRYYERGNKDWDYAIIVNSYICEPFDEYSLDLKTQRNYTLEELKSSWFSKQNTPCIFISAKERLGIDELRQELFKLL